MQDVTGIEATIRQIVREEIDQRLTAFRETMVMAMTGNAGHAPVSQTAQQTATRAMHAAANGTVTDLRERILEALRSAPNGVKAEQLRATLGLNKKRFTYAMTQLTASKAVKKQGDRRATMYRAAN